MSLMPSKPIPATATPDALARGVLHAPHPSRQSIFRAESEMSDPFGATLVVERLDPAAAAAHRDAWVSLAERALEPNVFLDPDFALPAARHFGAARRPSFVLIWSVGRAGGRDLVGVCPLVAGRSRIGAVASVWFHDLSTLGFPLLDRAQGPAALRALLLWLGRGPARGVVFRAMPTEGATAAALREVAAREDLQIAVLENWRRAALRRESGSGRAGLAALSAKGAKELRRLRRRLGERGTVGYASARSGEALRRAVDLFLALEAEGWKGEAGTALLARPALAGFARAMTRLLGQRDLCRVDSLTLDGVPVAMGIVLTAGEADFLWKIAYREDLARLSPGVQFVLGFTEAQREARGAAVTDSCAVADHPMIDRLWRDRIALADVAVATRPGRSPGFRVAVAAQTAARRLKAAAKRAVAIWRARRAGASRSRPTRAGAPR